MAHDLYELAVRAAHAGGALLRERFGEEPSGITAKSTRTDLVSDADRDAEALILGVIRRERPDDAIVAEEGGSREGTSGVSWFVDPLDGTANFLWGHPQWSVSIAVVDEAGDVAAVVYDPVRNETFSAGRGRGAFLGTRTLLLTPSHDLGEALLGTGFAYDAEERERQAHALATVLPRVRDIRRAGSAALDLAWVAAGRLDAFYETGLSPWDWAGGAAIVRLSGGEAEVMDGVNARPVFVASRPGLMAPLRDLLSESGLVGPT